MISDVLDHPSRMIEDVMPVLVRVGLTAEHAGLLNGPDGELLARRMIETLDHGSHGDKRLKYLGAFDLLVPKGYIAQAHLGSFRKKHRKDFYNYNSSLTDEIFGQTAARLIRGRKLRVKMYEVLETLSSKDCLNFLESQKALLVGAHGLSLVYEYAEVSLPNKCWSISYAAEEPMWEDSEKDKRSRIPRLHTDRDVGYSFELAYFERPIGNDCCLLCFNEVS